MLGLLAKEETVEGRILMVSGADNGGEREGPSEVCDAAWWWVVFRRTYPSKPTYLGKELEPVIR